MASSNHSTIAHRTKFPALSADKFRLTSEPGCRLSHWRTVVVYIHKDMRPQGYQWLIMPEAICNPCAEHAEHIQRAEPVGRAFIINTFSLFSITFRNFSWKKFSSIISIGWNFEMGRGRRGRRRGFWTRPRPAGESMEEVIYMRTDRRPSCIFCAFPIDLVAVLCLFYPHDECNERSPVTGAHRSTHGTDCPVSGSAMLGIGPQWHQFCRFIWCRHL